jgi:hypothetical protein
MESALRLPSRITFECPQQAKKGIVASNGMPL